ncbi:hypothetical protein HZA44_03650 [Candidatus Peregrinibacteria bacterium]|nr:hypothetical protein [Candidatus Peregrinibacteria bacterium]
MSIESKPSDQPLGHETVNGTELRLSWDDEKGYLLTFPQVDPDLDPLDPLEKTIVIGKDQGHSTLVVEYAREAAQYAVNPDVVCHQTGAFVKKLKEGKFAEEIREKVDAVTKVANESK